MHLCIYILLQLDQYFLSIIKFSLMVLKLMITTNNFPKFLLSTFKWNFKIFPEVKYHQDTHIVDEIGSNFWIFFSFFHNVIND